MRVVAGTARGRRLASPSGVDVRPTSDRVREAVFNALHSRGAVVDADVLDLFAGTGALGIEALSRGARRAVFVDRSAEAVDLVARNLRSCDLEDRARVVRADGLRWLTTTDDRWDLVLLDPPYPFDGWADRWSGWPAVSTVRWLPNPTARSSRDPVGMANRAVGTGVPW